MLVEPKIKIRPFATPYPPTELTDQEANGFSFHGLITTTIDYVKHTLPP